MTEMSQNPFADQTQDQPDNAPAIAQDNVDAPPEGGSLSIRDGIHGGWFCHGGNDFHGDELVMGYTHENQHPMTCADPMSSSKEEVVPHENHSPMNNEGSGLLDVIFWDHDAYLQTKELETKRGPSDWISFSGEIKIKGIEYKIKLLPITGLLEQLLRDDRKKNQYDVLQAPVVELLDMLGDKEDFYMEHPEECPVFISFLKKQGSRKPETLELGWHTFVVAVFRESIFELTLAMSFGEKIEVLDKVIANPLQNDTIYKTLERKRIRRQWNSSQATPTTTATNKLRERLAKRKKK